MTGWIEMATFDAVVFAVANLVLLSVGERMSPFKLPRFGDTGPDITIAHSDWKCRISEE